MNRLTALFFPTHNLVSISCQFIKLLKINVTETSIQRELESHPDFPSILSLSDSLDKWNIENAALRLDRSRFIELDAPFLTSTTLDSNTEFVIVNKIDGATLSIIDDTGREKKTGLEQFLDIWSGIAIVAEGNKNSGEKDYVKRAAAEKRGTYRTIAITLATLLLIALVNVGRTNISWQEIALTLTCLTGFATCCLLFSIQLSTDDSSPKICHLAGKSGDCKTVLNSAVSKIAGISMAEIGIVYFGISLALLLVPSAPGEMITLLFWCNALAIPYTIFSVVYQWRIVKSWCVLCLAVQSILWINFLVLSSKANFELNVLTTPYLLPFATTALLLVLAWVLIKPLIMDKLQVRKWRTQYNQLKNNKEIFSAYLSRQSVMPPLPDNLVPIVVGNPNATHTITVVSNPVCKPCADKHAQLTAILKETTDTKLHILFYSCDQSNHTQVKTVKHFFALQEENKDIEEALDRWYSGKTKNYDEWAKNFPVKDIERAAAQIDAHCSWCLEASIQYTPTVFIDGYALPRYYDLEEVALLIDKTFVSEPVLA